MRGILDIGMHLSVHIRIACNRHTPTPYVRRRKAN